MVKGTIITNEKILEEATKAYMSLYEKFRLNHHDVFRIGNYIKSFASEVPLTVIIDDPEDWATMRTTKKGMVKKILKRDSKASNRSKGVLP